jgi:hypothetical protein
MAEECLKAVQETPEPALYMRLRSKLSDMPGWNTNLRDCRWRSTGRTATPGRGKVRAATLRQIAQVLRFGFQILSEHQDFSVAPCRSHKLFAFKGQRAVFQHISADCDDGIGRDLTCYLATALYKQHHSRHIETIAAQWERDRRWNAPVNFLYCDCACSHEIDAFGFVGHADSQ